MVVQTDKLIEKGDKISVYRDGDEGDWMKKQKNTNYKL